LVAYAGDSTLLRISSRKAGWNQRIMTTAMRNGTRWKEQEHLELGRNRS
jgi:hypothetical protein